MGRFVNYHERALQCRELALRMSGPECRAQLRSAAEHWELLAKAREALDPAAVEPLPATSWRTAQARAFLDRAAEAERQASRGTGNFRTQLRGMAELWRGMARKALLLMELEERLARGEFDVLDGCPE
jgi:hypothetical protein